MYKNYYASNIDAPKLNTEVIPLTSHSLRHFKTNKQVKKKVTLQHNACEVGLTVRGLVVNIKPQGVSMFTCKSCLKPPARSYSSPAAPQCLSAACSAPSPDAPQLHSVS